MEAFYVMLSINIKKEKNYWGIIKISHEIDKPRYFEVTPRISPHAIIFKCIQKRRIMGKMPITNTQKTHQQSPEL